MSKNKAKEQREVNDLRRRVEALQAELSLYKRGGVPIEPVATAKKMSIQKEGMKNVPMASEPQTILLTDIRYLKQDFTKVAILSVIIIIAIVSLKIFTPL